MKLWLLKSKKGIVAYDSYDAFVICAGTEKRARAIAQASGGDEIMRWSSGYQSRSNVPFWTDEQYSTCVELVPHKRAEVILGSFNAG